MRMGRDTRLLSIERGAVKDRGRGKRNESWLEWHGEGSEFKYRNLNVLSATAATEGWTVRNTVSNGRRKKKRMNEEERKRDGMRDV